MGEVQEVEEEEVEKMTYHHEAVSVGSRGLQLDLSLDMLTMQGS